jgi:NADPH:quinone reductase-like Zn-dependent oxidoreductase/pimeloyl-ACP methyl ester carboxylesterase
VTIHTEFVEAGGMSFEVDMCGEGDQLAICLHGFPEHSFSWRYQLPLLARLGYRVWAPNQRGYGKSSRPEGVENYHIDKLVEDIGLLFDASGAKELTILAHDWGAVIAWAFAIRKTRPLANLIIMNVPHPAAAALQGFSFAQLRRSWYILFFQIPWLPEAALGRHAAKGVGDAIFNSSCDPKMFPDEVLDVYRNNAAQPGALTAMINYYRSLVRSGAMRELGKPDVAKITTPTLMVWGEEDVALGKELTFDTDKFVNSLTVRYLPGVSHWVQQEAPETVNAMIEAYLTGKNVPQASPVRLMKAATTQGFGPTAKLVIRNTKKPSIGPDDVLVEVCSSSVNPKDWKLNKNLSSVIPPLPFYSKPFLIGDDLAGVVVKRGEKVKNFEVGDEVYGMDMRLRTAACPEFAKIDQKCIAHKPSNLSFSEAASAPLAALTALQALQIGRVKEGSKVLVIGASGGVGTFAVQIAKAMGAKVTGVCSGRNTALVTKIGADAVFDYTREDYIGGTNDFDMVFDATSYESLSSCSSLMNNQGIFVSTGGNGKAIFESYWAQIVRSKQNAKNVWVNPNTLDLEILKAYFEQGLIKPIIDSEFPFEELDQAYARSRTGRAVGKIVINIGQAKV